MIQFYHTVPKYVVIFSNILQILFFQQHFIRKKETCNLASFMFCCRYHDNAFITSRALHIVNDLNSSATYPLLEAFFKYQVTLKIQQFSIYIYGSCYFSSFVYSQNIKKRYVIMRLSDI